MICGKQLYFSIVLNQENKAELCVTKAKVIRHGDC